MARVHLFYQNRCVFTIFSVIFEEMPGKQSSRRMVANMRRIHFVGDKFYWKLCVICASLITSTAIVMHWLRLISHAHLIHIFILVNVDAGSHRIYRVHAHAHTRTNTGAVCVIIRCRIAKWLALDKRAARTHSPEQWLYISVVWLQMNIDSLQLLFVSIMRLAVSTVCALARSLCRLYYIDFPASNAALTFGGRTLSWARALAHTRTQCPAQPVLNDKIIDLIWL